MTKFIWSILPTSTVRVRWRLNPTQMTNTPTQAILTIATTATTWMSLTTQIQTDSSKWSFLVFKWQAHYMVGPGNTIFCLPTDSREPKSHTSCLLLGGRSQSMVAMDEECQLRGKPTHYLGRIRARFACSIWANGIWKIWWGPFTHHKRRYSEELPKGIQKAG